MCICMLVHGLRPISHSLNEDVMLYLVNAKKVVFIWLGAAHSQICVNTVQQQPGESKSPATAVWSAS